MELRQGDSTRSLELLVTVSPLPSGDAPLALLIIEDISEISTLRDLVPICANCKNIRNDAEYWQSIESYFASYFGVDFTHGICPACAQKLYPDVARQRKESTDGKRRPAVETEA